MAKLEAGTGVALDYDAPSDALTIAVDTATLDPTATGFSVMLGDGTNVVTSAEPFVLVRMPFAATWTAWYIQADASGSIVCEVERATAGSPTSFSSIAGTAKPTLSSAQSNADTSLASWGDTTTDAGDVIKISVSGTPATVKRVAVHVNVTRAL